MLSKCCGFCYWRMNFLNPSMCFDRLRLKACLDGRMGAAAVTKTAWLDVFARGVIRSIFEKRFDTPAERSHCTCNRSVMALSIPVPAPLHPAALDSTQSFSITIKCLLDVGGGRRSSAATVVPSSSVLFFILSSASSCWWTTVRLSAYLSLDKLRNFQPDLSRV